MPSSLLQVSREYFPAFTRCHYIVFTGRDFLPWQSNICWKLARIYPSKYTVYTLLFTQALVLILDGQQRHMVITLCLKSDFILLLCKNQPSELTIK